MDEIFKRILDTLNGADFWIALAFLRGRGLLLWATFMGLQVMDAS